MYFLEIQAILKITLEYLTYTDRKVSFGLYRPTLLCTLLRVYLKLRNVLQAVA